MNNTDKKLPLYLISAALSNILYYALLIPAALLYPGYSPFQHTVSALGNTTINVNGWFLFSICLILIAISILPFIFCTKRWYETQLSVKPYIRSIQILGLFNSFSMVMIALFPTDIELQYTAVYSTKVFKVMSRIYFSSIS
jgi:hypothetical protein